jgi:transcriptional regulator with XRE-family HTH domain
MERFTVQPNWRRRGRNRPSSRQIVRQRDLYQVLLRELRIRSGLRQSQLAARLDRPQSFVSKYENGLRRLDITELRLVCHALGVSLNSFVRLHERSIREGVPIREPQANTPS